MAACTAVLLVVGAATPGLRAAQAAGCEDFVPAGCIRVKAGDRLDAVVKDKCYVLDENSTGANAYDSLHVLSGGKILFVDPGFDAGTQQPRTIRFKVSAMLIEKGGVVQAGSPKCPLGKEKGRLAIGIYGTDPTKEGTVNPPPSDKGIECMTNPKPSSDKLRCFPSDDYFNKAHYCTQSDTDDPCSNITAPASEPKNHVLESYLPLNFDFGTWGYKTIGVAYGGTLALYGYKGAKGLQDADGSWARENDPDDHCRVPTIATLDQDELKAWAKLTGNSWARLAGSTDKGGTTTLTLDREISDWEVGDEIVVGTTDWYANHSEQRTIRKITPLAIGTQIEVDTLKFPHSFTMFDVGSQSDFTNPVSRSAVDTRAVVGLLSRSIQFYSLGKTPNEDFPKTLACTADKTANPECYFGGHLIARQGFKQVAIQGVEFKWMGQGGRQGHYPVHFHLAKSTAYTKGGEGTGTFVKDSSVWDSMTRFVVIHGTHEITLARNVGYLSLGHGYFVEDASEIRNRLCHNLGVDARAALKEYVAEQQKMEHWCGGEPPPAARVVPPILDGSILKPGDPAPLSPTGSDTYMPTMFWVMNAYNELVGNAAVGVHGFGSCFWLLGSAVSGASISRRFDGFAGYNTIDYQAPLLRFRGNSCTTSPLALPSTREISPATIAEARNTGFTALENPYLTNGAAFGDNYWPVINGSFRPALEGDKNLKCSDKSDKIATLNDNVKTCVTTVLDRFSTSFNWTEVNFGSIWLRPWFYLFANGAVTDQLSGGLGFVTGGDWQQALPGYLALAQNNLFVGTTQPQDAKNLYALRSGPRFVVKNTENLSSYSMCPLGRSTCIFPEAGTGVWPGLFNPKRLLTIYDGPTYADGNAFLNVGAWKCDAQPCSGAKTPSDCKGLARDHDELLLPCGIYTRNTNPALTSGENDVAVIDVAIGWKQPNGFFYPPAFDYRRNSFLKSRSDSLNMCLTAAPGDYQNLTFQPGSCRHAVVDRTQDYRIGNIYALNGTIDNKSGPMNQLDASTIDFATILLDLDGTLTGATSAIDGRPSPGLTTSVSRNKFYDAPSQSPECLSYGLQTSPYTFISTVMGELRDSPKTESNAILRGGGKWGRTPAVAIYRQWKLKDDDDREKTQPCGQVCDGGQYGCQRASFMGMAELSQPSYLTMTQPQGLSSAQTGGLYYIDTNSGQQALSCEKANPGFSPATFAGDRSYVLYNLFPQRDSKTTYQLYVGDVKSIADIEFRYVRVTVHELDPTNPALQRVEQPCDPRQPGLWCSGLPQPNPVNGVLTVTLDHQKLLKAEAFTAKARPDYDRCMPRDLCYFDEGANQCRRCDPTAPDGNPKKCLRSGDFLQQDLTSMNALDKNKRRPLDDVCEEWSSMVSGQIKVNNGADVTSANCPAGGCLGFAFKLPKGFQPQFYQTVNAGQGGLPLSRCFVESTWMKDVLNKTSDDTQCGAPRPQKSKDFCSDPKLDLPDAEDDTISQSNPGLNLGESPELVVAGDQRSNQAATGDASGGHATEHTLVAFDAGAIESFLANQPLTRATLEVTTKAPVEGQGVLVDADPLLRQFAEGNPDGEKANAASAAEVGLSRATALTPIGGRVRLPFIPGPGGGSPAPDVPGATWNCASDPDPGNGVADDCLVPWSTPGGDYGAATAQPALVGGPDGTVIGWDVTADVMAGVSSWLLRLHDEASSGVLVFYSKEGALQIGDPEAGPVLVLE